MVEQLDFKGAYNGENYDIVPRAVIVINETATIPLSYSLSMNGYLESDSLNVELPMELIDYKEIFETARSKSDFVKIELYSGFINSQSKQHLFVQSIQGGLSNDQLKKKFINEKIYKDVLALRWWGMVEKFSLNWGSVNQTDVIGLQCGELFNKLGYIEFEKKYEADKATVGNIINDISKFLTKIKIRVSKEVKQENLNVVMGAKIKYAKDNEDGSEGTEEKKEEFYTTKGKKVLDIIRELCVSGKLEFVQVDEEPYTYEFRPIYTPSKLWTLDRAKHFTNLKLEQGDGSNNSNNGKMLIKVVCKDSKGEQQKFLYPSELQNDSIETLNVKTIVAPPNSTQEKMKQMAIDYFLSYNKAMLYGSLTMGEPLTMLKPYHAIEIIDTSDVPKLRKIELKDSNGKNLQFKIVSLDESFKQGEGLRQNKLEFILNNTRYHVDVNNGKINNIYSGINAQLRDGLESNKATNIEKINRIKNSIKEK